MSPKDKAKIISEYYTLQILASKELEHHKQEIIRYKRHIDNLTVAILMIKALPEEKRRVLK